jgi:hypothetical protein
VSGAATDLFDLADTMLSVCVDALALLPAGAPERAYVGHGLPAIDCEQLVVSTYQLPLADTSPRSLPLDRMFKEKYGSLNLPMLVVSIARCYPCITLDKRQEPIFPSVAELTAASELVYADGWQLWNGIKTAKRLGAFGGLCRELAMDPMLPLQPQGGFAGWTIPVEIQLDGFSVAFP